MPSPQSLQNMETFQYFLQRRREMADRALLGGDLDATLNSMWAGWDLVQRVYVPGRGGWHGFVFTREQAWGVTMCTQRHARDWDEVPRPRRGKRVATMLEQTFAAPGLDRLLTWLDTAASDMGWAATRALLAVQHPEAEAVRFLAVMGAFGDRVAEVHRTGTRRGGHRG